jgi:hypothetical protein
MWVFWYLESKCSPLVHGGNLGGLSEPHTNSAENLVSAGKQGSIGSTAGTTLTFACARGQAGHLAQEIRLEEERNGVTMHLGVEHDPMHRRLVQSVGPALQHITDVHDERAWQLADGTPLALNNSDDSNKSLLSIIVIITCGNSRSSSQQEFTRVKPTRTALDLQARCTVGHKKRQHSVVRVWTWGCNAKNITCEGQQRVGLSVEETASKGNHAHLRRTSQHRDR